MNERTDQPTPAGPPIRRPEDAPDVVLASASAARARLLRSAGVAVRVHPAAVDEGALKQALQADGLPAGEAAVALAELKARRVADQIAGDVVVLGADQILTCGDRWLDKPETMAAARLQLQQLAGRRHELWTAAVALRGGARIWHHVSEARLWLRTPSAAWVADYLDAIGERVLTIVGGYEVEDLGAQLLTRVVGDHFAIQGLPLLEVLELLRDQGVLGR